ncbi:hypothetical protein RQM65_08180 [Pricia sp. S334]|uniref:Cytochrome c domain-containing protein n=1 Tax=Pricia mediterranea TaxID=3076079 RepID=A0ABU3L5Z8_9FLAO|nr:hypothetical protein [Pricia sp. S334]MDT7828639.1 hypothetical protein [Pricia sp. S334]
MKKAIPLVILIGVLFVSCSNDSESDLMDPDPDGPISYEANIKQIIGNNCLGCHSAPPVNGAPFALTTYDQVRNSTENGNLLAAIKRQTGESAAMPPAGRLPQSTIDLIEQWADEGFLER